MSELFEPVEELVEKVGEELTDTVFSPRPGGMVDRWQKEKARKEAADEERKHTAERVEEPSYKAVKTTQEMPEVLSTITINIPVGGSAQVLPASPYRYRATIIANTTMTAAANPILSKDSSQALGGIGFPLPLDIPFIVMSRAQLWAYNPASNTELMTISVLAEIYAPEK